MNKLAVILKSILLGGIALSAMFAAAQGSGTSKLPDEPKPKTQSPPSATPSPFKDQKEKNSYAIGLYFGRSLAGLAVDSKDIDNGVLMQGLQDALAGGKVQMTDDELRATLVQMQTEAVARQKAAGEAFLAANKAKPDVVTLPSGLQYKILTPGTGPKPAATDTVVCNYKGTLINGTEFDNSYKRGEPLAIEVGRVIKGWTEALQLMPVGSKWQLFIPSNLGYGERGSGGIPPNSTLIFEVELLSIQPKPAPPATPATPPPTPK